MFLLISFPQHISKCANNDGNDNDKFLAYVSTSSQATKCSPGKCHYYPITVLLISFPQHISKCANDDNDNDNEFLAHVSTSSQNSKQPKAAQVSTAKYYFVAVLVISIP